MCVGAFDSWFTLCRKLDPKICQKKVDRSLNHFTFIQEFLVDWQNQNFNQLSELVLRQLAPKDPLKEASQCTQEAKTRWKVQSESKNHGSLQFEMSSHRGATGK